MARLTAFAPSAPGSPCFPRALCRGPATIPTRGRAPAGSARAGAGGGAARSARGGEGARTKGTAERPARSCVRTPPPPPPPGEARGETAAGDRPHPGRSCAETPRLRGEAAPDPPAAPGTRERSRDPRGGPPVAGVARPPPDPGRRLLPALRARSPSAYLPRSASQARLLPPGRRGSFPDRQAPLGTRAAPGAPPALAIVPQPSACGAPPAGRRGRSVP